MQTHPSQGTARASFATVTDTSLSWYLRDIHRFPVLSADEELELARRWRGTHDQEAGHKLVTSHLRLVAKIAMSYRGYGFPLGELIGEGHVGMMKALERFEPDLGFRLSTYALWWIRSSIQEYVLHSWSIVRMGTTGAQKKLFFNLRRLKRQIELVDDNNMTADQVSQIATVLDVPAREVADMDRRLVAADASLNAPIRSEGHIEWQDWLVDETPNQETEFADREELSRRKALLRNALNALTKRERHILSERRLRDQPTRLEALSRHYGVSHERIRQIERRALVKLQKEIRAQAKVRRAATTLSRRLAGTAPKSRSS